MSRQILPPPGEDREDVVVLLPDWCSQVVDKVVEFLYCGAIHFLGGEKGILDDVISLLKELGIRRETLERYF